MKTDAPTHGTSGVNGASTTRRMTRNRTGIRSVLTRDVCHMHAHSFHLFTSFTIFDITVENRFNFMSRTSCAFALPRNSIHSDQGGFVCLVWSNFKRRPTKTKKPEMATCKTTGGKHNFVKSSLRATPLPSFTTDHWMTTMLPV